MLLLLPLRDLSPSGAAFTPFPRVVMTLYSAVGRLLASALPRRPLRISLSLVLVLALALALAIAFPNLGLALALTRRI